MKTIEIRRYEDHVKLTNAFSHVTIEDLLNACEDNDMSLNSSVTGHLMLIDDRFGETYMLNDYGIDVIDQLNETGNFKTEKSILEYSLFN